MSEVVATVVVSGTLLGVGTNRYKDSEGKRVSQRVLVFPTEDIQYRRIVTIPAEDEEQAVELLTPLVGSEISVLVGPGNYGKLWYQGLA